MIMPILLPVLLGLALLGMPGERSAKWVQGYVRASILLQVVLIGVVLGLTGSNASFLLFQLTSNLMIYFKIDAINRISTCVMTLILVCTGLYTTSDGKEKRQEKRFCGFYLIFCGMVTGLNFAGNLITFYFFWEWMSVASIPLVLHRQTREAYFKGLQLHFGFLLRFCHGADRDLLLIPLCQYADLCRGRCAGPGVEKRKGGVASFGLPFDACRHFGEGRSGALYQLGAGIV